MQKMCLKENLFKYTLQSQMSRKYGIITTIKIDMKEEFILAKDLNQNLINLEDMLNLLTENTHKNCS